MQLTIEQLRTAVEREKANALRYMLSRSPALAKFYQKRAKELQAQLETEEMKHVEDPADGRCVNLPHHP
jgi:mannose/fructose/N-acetylgalactosamine-specific phosphotransferase system component IID